MSELTERLRAYAKDQGGWHSIDETCEKAADEIDRLTAALEKATPPPSSHLRGRIVAPVEVYRIIKDVVIDKDNVAVWSRRIAAALSDAPSPETDVAGCQDISTAPANTSVLVWWPIVKLDEDGDPTDEVVDGCWLISENQCGYWIEPESMNAIGDHMGDDHTYANKPSKWMPLPAPLFTATTEGSDNG